MKMFYGHGRAPEDAPPGCDQVWLDDAKSKRQERADMMLSLRDGDEVVVLARSDLGRGAEVAALEAAISDVGASLVVDAPEVMPRKRGRPRTFNPDAEQNRKIKRLYHGFNVMPYVLTRARAIMGWDVEDWHLKRKYGNRWKKAPADTPLAETEEQKE